MSLPGNTITLSNGNVGAVEGGDGIMGLIVSGVAVAGKFALGDVLGPFYSKDDAIAMGITAAYDTANTCMAYKHIKDFYDEAGEGHQLYVMVLNKTVKLSEQVDKDLQYGKKLLTTAAGKIKFIGATRIPDEAYAPVYLDQFDSDNWTAITKAQALFTEEYALGRPVQFILEGRDFQGTPGTAKDLRDAAGPNASKVSIVMSQDNTFAAANAYAAKHASVGAVLGRLAKIHVGRNIGRVLDGPLAIQNAGMSNGVALSGFTDANLGALHDKGYIIMRKFANRTGVYFNSDPVCAPLTDDYNSISRNRAILKAVRLTNEVYTDFINDDPELDPATGKMNVAECMDLQATVEQKITENMLAGVKEISGVKATVDPAANILQTKRQPVKLRIVPKGALEGLDVNLAYSTTI